MITNIIATPLMLETLLRRLLRRRSRFSYAFVFFSCRQPLSIITCRCIHADVIDAAMAAGFRRDA